jgi:hypothetical protein
MTHLDDRVIRGEDDIPWGDLPDWVNWWVAESWGGSWGWQEEPQVTELEEGFGPQWLAESGHAPMFAGWVQGIDWKSSKRKRPESTDGTLGDPPEAVDAESH